MELSDDEQINAIADLLRDISKYDKQFDKLNWNNLGNDKTIGECLNLYMQLKMKLTMLNFESKLAKSKKSRSQTKLTDFFTFVKK